MKYMEKPDYQKAKEKAEELLRNLGYDSPPISPIDIANESGLSVYEINMNDEYESVAGLIDFEQNEILVNAGDTLPRKMFTIAHELGHYILHKKIFNENPEKYKVLYRQSILNSNDSYEKEANYFAASLLVPINLLDEYSRYGYSNNFLSTIFQVSVEVIKYRLNDYKKKSKFNSKFN